MKKTIFACLLAGISLCAFAQNAVIKDLFGTVELKPAGAAAFIPATAGAQVMPDTVISTGFKSTALVEVGSAVIAVRPLTRLTLTEISASYGAENLNVNLQAGRVRVDVNPPAGAKASLTIVSPIATASVRGTSFYFDTMNVSVREGTVAFKGSKGYTVQVGAGSFSGVDAYNIASGAQRGIDTGFTPPGPAGYEPASMGTTGGTGPAPSVPDSPSGPSGPSGPTGPSYPSGPSGGGGGGGDTGVNVTIKY
jgi:hypothetical protein